MMAARVRDHSVGRDDGVAFDAKVFGHERLIPGNSIVDTDRGDIQAAASAYRAAANFYSPNASSVCMMTAGEMRNRPA